MAIYSKTFKLVKVSDGDKANAYSLIASQPEILKFVENENEVKVSPSNLILHIRKEDPTNKYGFEQVILSPENLENLTIELLDYSVGEWKNLAEIMPLNEFVAIENNNIKVNFETFYNFNYEGSDESSALASFKNGSGAISFTYVLKEATQTYNLFESVDFRFNEPWEIVSFAQNASDITMAIQETGLKFDATGLNIYGGGFTIYDNNKEKPKELLSINNGNLSMTGNITATNGTFNGIVYARDGTFNGTVTATNGSFNGLITATGGKIGGFTINEDSLVSINEEIILDGTEGKIIAQNIELGTGATISDHIKLGSGKVTLNNSSKFLIVREKDDLESAEVLSINDEGVIAIGVKTDNMITIDGTNGVIKSQNYDSGLGWKISGSDSIFNDVTVHGSIRASVLEYGEVQTVSGALIVRPSSRIKNIEYDSVDNETKITLEDSTGFNVGDTCLINESLEKKWIVITKIEKNNIFIKEEEEEKLSTKYISHPLVSFGKKGDVGIGINGSTSDALITPTSLSVFEFVDDNINGKRLVPHIILGKLPDDGYGLASGTYGLYAENVLLKGSLVTSTVIKEEGEEGEEKKVTYSGISTLYGKDAPTSENYKQYFGENKVSEILLWAGAESDTKDAIEKSNFFVDRNGNMYAKSGYFDSSIITNSRIFASEIVTAKISGSGTSPDPALKINDATLGIVFQKKVENEGIQKEEDVFVVGADEIKAVVDSINFNENFKIDNKGSLYIPETYIISSNGKHSLYLTNSFIAHLSNFNKEEKTGEITSFMGFGESSIEFYPGKNAFSKGVEITSQGTKIFNVSHFTNTVKYGDGDSMRYTPVYEEKVLIGYDLYID